MPPKPFDFEDEADCEVCRERWITVFGRVVVVGFVVLITVCALVVLVACDTFVMPSERERNPPMPPISEWLAATTTTLKGR